MIKKLIRKIKKWFKKFSLTRRYKKNKEYTPQRGKEMLCALYGHKWVSAFSPKKELKGNIEDRMYCKYCGQKYHEHTYISSK